MKLKIYGIVILLSFDFSFGETIDFNPYEVLSVDHGASAAEIRSVYKKLAREWHPDKNKSPDAQDKFIKIQQAYEILSDEDKREQYDTGGYSSDSVGQWHSYGEPFNFRYSDFDFFSRASTRTLSMHDYYSRVLPESHRTPQLIYVYSTFCGQCILWLRTSWQKAASDMESLGVAVYTVDTTFTSRIASSLGVNRVPTIVGLYKERTYYFKGQISKEELKFFINSFLPSDIITQITSKNVDDFLEGILSDDKPRAVLFSDKKSPTLLYSLLALKYQKYFRFGYVNVKAGNTAMVMKKFAVSQYGPTLLVFKDYSGRPSVLLGANEMPHGALNEILSANRFVVVPRLTSPEVFDEVCAAPHGTVHTVRLCMILVSDPSFGDHVAILTNLKKLVQEAESKEDSLNEWLAFMQVYTSKQPAFTQSLLSEEQDQPKLLLLWRRGQKMSSIRQLDVDFLRLGFASAKEEFQVCLRKSLETAHLQRFESTVTLSPLIDELAPHFVIQILQKFLDFVEYVGTFSEKQVMATLMVATFLILMFSSLFGSSKDETRKQTAQERHARYGTEYAADHQESEEEESEVSDDISVESNAGSTPSVSSYQTSEASVEDDSVEPSASRVDSPATRVMSNTHSRTMHELDPHLYESSVLNQSRGHMTVVLLLCNDADNKDILIGEYQKVMKVFTRDPKITITCLDVMKYSSWYHELRRSSSAEPPDETGRTEDMSTLHSNADFDKVNFQGDHVHESPAQASGSVLALNGARHWYCIFVPRSVKLACERETPTKTGNTGSEEDTYGAALSCWMDRVREGQMPRLYVRQWPGLYIHSHDGDDEEGEIF